MRQLTEIQSFKDHKPIMILLLVSLGIPLVLVVMQLLKHELSNEEWLSVSIAFTVTLITILVIFRIRTHVKLTDSGIEFKSNPFTAKLTKIKLADISEFYVSNHKWYHGLGYKITMSATKIYVMKPGKVLVIKTTDGREYRFGINRPVLVAKFLADNWTENLSEHGG